MTRRLQSNVMALPRSGWLLPPPFPFMATGDGRVGKLRMVKAEPQNRSADDLRRSAQMASAQAGDRVAYKSLLRECVPLIRSIADRQRVPPDQVDDVVQEVLLTIHRARQTYDPGRSFNGWLRIIAERRAIDLLRRVGRQRAREIHSPLALNPSPMRARTRRIQAAMLLRRRKCARRLRRCRSVSAKRFRFWCCKINRRPKPLYSRAGARGH